MTLALWHVTPRQSELRPVAPPGPGRVAVRASYSMISCGTERLVALGRVPPSAAEAMAVPYMEGEFGFPIKYGYSLVGEDPDGRPVHCLHPHQQTAYVRPSDLFELPAGLPRRRATLISNTETALNAIWDAGPLNRGNIAICGFGGIGALLAMTLRVGFDIEPLVVETDGYRRRKAEDLGFESRDAGDATEDLAIAFHATGSESGLQWCIDHGGMEARIVDLGWYGERISHLRLGDRFHYLRHRIISSQVSTVAESMRSTTTLMDRKRRVADLLTDDSFGRLLHSDVDFAKTPEFFTRLRSNELEGGLIWLIRYVEE